MTSTKRLFRQIHLYLSLAAGLVVAVVCFTGAVLVFEKELEEAWHPARYRVAQIGATRLPLDQLAARARASVPGATVTSLKVYANPTHTVEVSLVGKDKPKAGSEGQQSSTPRSGAGKEGKGGPGGKARSGGGEGGGPKVFVDPYTGAVTGQLIYRETFFFQMMALHRGMVGGDAGKLVVGVSTIFFLFIILTGLVLWWPASRKALRHRLKVKADGSWKRFNHDLHVTLGFYASLFLFVFAFTGLAWSFEWFNDGIFTLTHSEKKGPEPPQSTVAAPGGTHLPFDAVYAAARQVRPSAAFYSLQLPNPAESLASVRVVVPAENAPFESATDELYFDNNTVLRPLGALPFAKRNLGQRVRRTFKPVHTGAIFGWPSKMVALLACLLGTSFPITGLIMWLNRVRKEKRRQGKSVNRPEAVIG